MESYGGLYGVQPREIVEGAARMELAPTSAAGEGVGAAAEESFANAVAMSAVESESDHLSPAPEREGDARTGRTVRHDLDAAAEAT